MIRTNFSFHPVYYSKTLQQLQSSCIESYTRSVSKRKSETSIFHLENCLHRASPYRIAIYLQLVRSLFAPGSTTANPLARGGRNKRLVAK